MTAYNSSEIKISNGFYTKLITTISSKGVPNVAPITLCTCVSVNPPFMSLTISKKLDGTSKDSEINIDDTK